MFQWRFQQNGHLSIQSGFFCILVLRCGRSFGTHLLPTARGLTASTQSTLRPCGHRILSFSVLIHLLNPLALEPRADAGFYLYAAAWACNLLLIVYMQLDLSICSRPVLGSKWIHPLAIDYSCCDQCRLAHRIYWWIISQRRSLA